VVGSPFKVRVGEPGQAGNPALVSAYGAGLETGTTGKKRCFPRYLSSSLWES
jgi:filamin